jgi:hypothetical protein
LYGTIKILVALWSLFCLVGLYVGLNAPEAGKAGVPMFVSALNIGFWGMVWFVPTVGLGVIGLLLRPRTQIASGLPSLPVMCPECGKYHPTTERFCPHCEPGRGEASSKF